MARPLSNIDPKKVVRLASYGCTLEEIAATLDTSISTLKKRFQPQLKKGREGLKTNLRTWQIKSARAGNTTMQIWLGKNYLGQSDNRHPDPPDKGKDEVVIK